MDSFEHTRQGTRQEVCACMATLRGTINLNLLANLTDSYTSFSSLLSLFQTHVFGDECHPSAAVPPLKSYNIQWKAHLLSITLERSCWWPHKSHVNELWERPISHHARCALPLLFMAIIGPCFLRQWLCTDGSDDDYARLNNQEEVREGKLACAEGTHVWEKRVYMMQNGFKGELE